jgi:hypothetical protein
MELAHVQLSQTQVNRKKFHDFEKLHFDEAKTEAQRNLENANYDPVAVSSFYLFT